MNKLEKLKLLFKFARWMTCDFFLLRWDDVLVVWKLFKYTVEGKCGKIKEGENK